MFLILKIVIILFYIFYYFCNIFKLLYLFQSNGYTITSYLIVVKRCFVDSVVFYVLSIMFSLLFFFLFDVYISCLSSLIFLFLFYKSFRFLKEVKFTKRLLRLGVVTSLIFLFLCYLFLLLLIDNYISVNCLIFLSMIIFFILFLSLFFAVIILSPLEKIIFNFYLSKAKRKLMKYSNLVRVGITGSYGKTSTKEILCSILNEKFNVLKTPKSYNTPMGIAKTINYNDLSFCDFFVCEIGAKKLGEVDFLCRYVDVNVGIVTAVGRQHLNTFGSIDNIYKTKNELPNFLSGKLCVFNLMNYYVSRMYENFSGEKIGVFYFLHTKICNNKGLIKSNRCCKYFANKNFKGCKFFIFCKKNNVYAKSIIVTSEFTLFDLYYDNRFVCSLSTTLMGVHNVINILLAVAIAIKYKVDTSKIISGVLKLKSIDARLEKFKLDNGAIVINNGYNSNLDSAKSTISVLGLFDKKYKFVITPGVIDCIDSYSFNYSFGKIVAMYATDVVIVKNENKNAILNALNDCDFDMSRVKTVANFEQAKKLFDCFNGDYVVLIENDLPNSFK